MNRFPIATAAFALLLAAAGSAGVSAWAQSGPPARPGTVPSPGKADNPVTPSAPQRGPAATLERLFQRLHDATTQEEAEGVARLIQRRWARSGSDTADLLMTRAQQALQDKQVEIAIELLDRVIGLQPDWAEAWNKRATLAFLDKRDDASVDDIARALALEPRHFGAVSGFAQICLRRGYLQEARAAFQMALRINPHLQGVGEIVEALGQSLERPH